MNMQFCTPGFASAYGYAQGQTAGMSYNENQYPLHTAYPGGYQYLYGYQPPRPPMMADRGGMCDGKTDSKPRLSKEEVEKLEKVFQDNPKPSSSVKAQLADNLGLERARINNWFQNRRAKAKQERKQEEYEARRAAEKASEPSSPDEDSSLDGLDIASEESGSQHAQASSAAFPTVSSPPQITETKYEDVEDEEDDDDDEEDIDIVEISDPRPSSASPMCMQSSITSQNDLVDAYQSPISAEFSQSAAPAFIHPQHSGVYTQTRSMSDFGLSTSMGHGPQAALNERTTELHHGLPFRVERSMSTEGLVPQHYNGMHSAMLFSPLSNGVVGDMSESQFDSTASPDCHDGQDIIPHGLPTPIDSFRSPPPPANIATRRKIARPAALQTTALRSRSYNVPKTALDGSKRMDIPSPISSIRRISSATGMGPGRIHKSSAGPRSPYFGRAEALLQYHNRSPVGSVTPTLSGAPPTPMTPAIFDQQHIQEPTVISASPDNGSFGIGMGITSNYSQDMEQENDLKTPPTTPGLMHEYGTNGFINNAFNTGFNITNDQPLFTPYLHSEFPDLSMQNVPDYVETSDGGPPTPVYSTMMNSNLEHAAFPRNVASNTQYDWDANEPVVSSRSSPGYPRSKQIQFTPNITPQDYH
ncbi:hypothetical protein F4808DRAFT_73465 [Astrocystis sublimbata]|nr:hypothetical protein F4808DRAFT_73465 [Astrocystis sublimbata]